MRSLIRHMPRVHNTLPSLTFTKASSAIRRNGRRIGYGGYGQDLRQPEDDNIVADELARTGGPDWPSKRHSPWPFLLVLGLVLGSVGLILTLWVLSVMGAVLFIFVLTYWLSEVCADFSRLPD